MAAQGKPPAGELPSSPFYGSFDKLRMAPFVELRTPLSTLIEACPGHEKPSPSPFDKHFVRLSTRLRARSGWHSGRRRA